VKTLLIPIIALCAASCATKDPVVEETQNPVKAAPPEQPVLADNKPMTPDDGLRINEDDILALPTNDQLRTHKNTTVNADSPIIVRPPTE